MENQQVTNPNVSINPNSNSIVQQSTPSQTKTNFMIPILLTLVISGVVFGIGGYYLGSVSSLKPDQKITEQISTLPTSNPNNSPVTATETSTPTVAPTTDPAANWKIYTETREVKFSIKYPSAWTVDTKDGMYGEKGVRFDSGSGRIGSVGIGWNQQPVEPNCNTGTEKKEVVQIKGRTIEMCHSAGSTQEPEGYFYNSTKNGVSYSVVTSNYPGEENRQMILKILSTLEI